MAVASQLKRQAEIMSSVNERLQKLREERVAREKARIEKLRELNLKKYSKTETQHSTAVLKNVKSADSTNVQKPHLKNYLHQNTTANRPLTTAKHVPAKETSKIPNPKPIAKSAPIIKQSNKIPTAIKPDLIQNLAKKPTASGDAKRIPSANTKEVPKKSLPATNQLSASSKSMIPASRKSVAPPSRKSVAPPSRKSIASTSRKSIAPKPEESDKQSVFERLYKPKVVVSKPIEDAVKMKTDPNYLKKVIRASGLILNKRHTVFDMTQKVDLPVRRSISAVHFKRIHKNEINNCVHKWASIGDKMNKIHLNELNEDESVQQDRVVSAIKSERKRVKFQTPVPFNFNTPKPEELQSRLQSWLQKRGKSLDSYHHLQCFGIHHIRQREVLPIEPPKFELYDDENKENIALEHDSDNDSYTENMNEDEKDDMKDRWRRASCVSDSVDLNDTQNSTLTSYDIVQQVDEVLLGALNDLTELLREGFDWEQCARWLRAIRERFPLAPDTAAYWECRAALEETRGDLPASVQCWEEAIAKGTERSVVESNLDQLLDKFMQLKISPSSGKRKPVNSKMVDVKNVFKSTIIRFAVQQAKLRSSSQLDLPKYTVTPVRRSGRLSQHWSAKRPLQECSSVKHATELAPVKFVPNDKLCRTP